MGKASRRKIERRGWPKCRRCAERFAPKQSKGTIANNQQADWCPKCSTRSRQAGASINVYEGTDWTAYVKLVTEFLESATGVDPV